MISVEQAWFEYQQSLSAFIRSKVATSHDAEDILNDVYAALLEKTNTDNQPDHVSSWLYQVTRNKIIDYYRGKTHFEPLPEDHALEPSDNHAIKQLSTCLLPMIQALPEKYQQVLMLADIEGKKNKVVADELGLSLSAVKSRILRGRKKLQKSLLQCCTIHYNHSGKVIDYDQKKANVPNGCNY